LVVAMIASALAVLTSPIISAKAAATPASAMLDIRDFGAVGDGARLNTKAIQAAIDSCGERRAPGVLVAGGQFVTGTLQLKSYVTLHIAAGAELLGSTNIADYRTDTHPNMYKGEPNLNRCLIFAREAEHFGIEGGGVIDGRGSRDNFPNQNDPVRNRPMMINFVECSSIRLRDITLRNPASWTTAWLYCTDIAIDGITIQSRANDNGDGLDFDGCVGVRVSNSALDTSDDSICLQTSKPDRPCRDVTISNCIFVSRWAGIRIGLLSRGDFLNVTVSNCVFRDIQDSGLKIQMCEGGEMKNMLFTSLIMENVPRPVFMTFGQQRAAYNAPPGVAPMKAMRDFVFSNLLVDSSACGRDSAFILVGLPGHPIENVTLDNIRFRSGGSGTVEHAAPKTLPDLTLQQIQDWWPEYSCFKRTVPCFGIYAGHLKGLTIREAIFDAKNDDARPAVICDDVINLEINGVKVAATASPEPLVFLNNVKSAWVANVRSTGASRKIVRRAGAE
jgi:polygalacturonase